MIGFKNKQEFEEWAHNQITKYGIRQPDTYTEHKDKVTQ